MLKGKTIVELALDLAAGAVTEKAIREQLGEGVLTRVLSISGGLAAGVVASSLINTIDKETGIVSDIGSLVDDIFDLF